MCVFVCEWGRRDVCVCVCVCMCVAACVYVCVAVCVCMCVGDDQVDCVCLGCCRTKKKGR